jgi:hypothetical protein
MDGRDDYLKEARSFRSKKTKNVAVDAMRAKSHTFFLLLEEFMGLQ